MAEEERLLIVPLRKVKHKVPRTKRVPRSIKFLKEFVARHLKVDVDKVKIDQEVNELIWAKGIQKPPSKIKVSVKREEEFVKVSLP